MANLKILFKLGCVIFIGVVVQQKSLSAEVCQYNFAIIPNSSFKYQ